MTDQEIVQELRTLLKEEIDDLLVHDTQMGLAEMDPEYLDPSWVYDMYRATDDLGRAVPWEQILRILS